VKGFAEIDTDLASTDESVRWAAAAAASELVESNPGEAWRLVLRHGVSQIEDTRSAVATCILEHLLEHHFHTIFPMLEAQINGGNRLLGDTFRMCWKLGQTEQIDNSERWNRLLHRIEAR
jgi:hypothetical protein